MNSDIIPRSLMTLTFAFYFGITACLDTSPMSGASDERSDISGVQCKAPSSGANEMPEDPEPVARLSCTISANKPVYAVGDVPDINVQIKNESKRNVVLVGSLDASARKWRYPHCYFEIRTPVTSLPSSIPAP